MRRAIVVAVCALAVGGCKRDRIVDERLLAALEEARALQHSADVHLAGGESDAAIADVKQVLAIDFHGAAEGEEARLDAWARLAELELAAHADEEGESRALADVEHGRHEATRDSFYRAHLETVAGQVYEARAKRLAADDAAARAARKDALDAYARAIAIAKRVQSELAKERP